MFARAELLDRYVRVGISSKTKVLTAGHIFYMYTAELIFEHFPELTPKQKEQFEQLGPLYEEWNAKINVILARTWSPLTKARLAQFGHCAGLWFLARPGSAWCGYRWWFPGIPLAILYPETEFHLVDSIGKKIKVVNAVAEAIGLENVKARRSRGGIEANMILSFSCGDSYATLHTVDQRKIDQENFDDKRPNGCCTLKVVI